MTRRVRKKIERSVRTALNAWARRKLSREGNLLSYIERYIDTTHWTSRYYYKWWRIFSYVRTEKPVQILELGSGISSLIMTLALQMNEAEGHPKGAITSLEENSGEYFENLLESIPADLRTYITFVHSRKIEKTWGMFHGVCYEHVPDKAYDFIFIDGPTTTLGSGDHGFDGDVLNILASTDQELTVMIDNRKSTCAVLRILFGMKIQFHRFGNIGFGRISKKDMRVGATGLGDNLFGIS